MRPVSLEFCGINSFSEPQKIDFEQLLQYGIFGIFGDTGSGKSTILDCIGFALYGEVMRARSGKIADIINYDQNKAFVHFEFDIDYAGKRRRYRVERELKRKNASQNLKVYEFDEEKDAFLCVADAVRQGNELLKAVIGLEQRDYEKCIALPQGEFAQFVRSAPSDRLKLISRLFDLERYGERLVKRVNAAFKDAEIAVELSKTKLLPYGQISEETNGRLREEIGTLSKTAETLKKKLDEVREREKSKSADFEKGKEKKVWIERFEKLKSGLPQMEILEKELTQLSAAETVRRTEEALRRADCEKKESEIAFQNANGKLLRAKETEANALLWDAEKAENELAALNEQRLRSEEREKHAKRAAELQEQLRASREEYRRLKDKFPAFDYEKEKKEIEDRIASYGKAGAFQKAAFFREEYAEFKDELEAVEKKFPETEEEVEPLIRKYSALAKGETADFSVWEKENAEREKLVKQEHEKLRILEQRNGDYKAHQIRLKNIEEEGLRLKKEFDEIQKTISEAIPLAELEARIVRLKNETKSHVKEIEDARKARSAAEANVAVCAERVGASNKIVEERTRSFSEALANGHFKDGAAANALLEKYGDEEAARARAVKFREDYAFAKAQNERLKAVPFVDAEEITALQNALQEAERENEECVASVALKKDELARAEEALKVKIGFEKELKENEKELSLCERLKKLLEGNKFMEFIAEEYLTAVSYNASGRLLSLTNGQYFLKYDGGFYVGDNLHGGALRGVNTLSGGETFLVSLSLALSLSQEIGARYLRSSEFFFLDEGFGTLDSKLVDTVMDSLEKLRNEKFSIGIISHVEELKHRINRKLTVKKATEKHGSQIITE